MLAMNNTMNGDYISETMPSSPEAVSPQQAPLPSGLSALIQAATSQLGHLADVASSQHKVDDAATPIISPQQQHSFPEQLMTLCLDPENFDTITFLPDGKFFAVRQSSFQDSMLTYFDCLTQFSDFVRLTEEWGFSRIGGNDTEIVVFRHPKFISGDYAKCRLIRQGESPETVRMHALPNRRIVSGTTDDNTISSQPKRRLSPGFLAHKDSVSSLSSRQRRYADSDTTDLPERKVSSGGESDLSYTESKLPLAPFQSDEDYVRSTALSITTEKLKLDQHNEDTLAETAVTSATHGIVTEAIESLLRDECHSKKTFLKHEKELSRSSLPGVIPVCKQLFAPTVDPASNKEFSKANPPHVVTTFSKIDGDDTKASVTSTAAQYQDLQGAPSDKVCSVMIEEQPAPVLQEASNSKHTLSTTPLPTVARSKGTTIVASSPLAS